MLVCTKLFVFLILSLFFAPASSTRKKSGLLITASSPNLLLSNSSHLIFSDSLSKQKQTVPRCSSFLSRIIGTRRAPLQINRKLHVNVKELRGWIGQCRDFCPAFNFQGLNESCSVLNNMRLPDSTSASLPGPLSQTGLVCNVIPGVVKRWQSHLGATEIIQ